MTSQTAKLTGPPFPNASGELRAPALINGAHASILMRPEHTDLKRGQTLGVVQSAAGDWRAAP